MNDNEWLVSEVIRSIQGKHKTIKMIADELGVSDRTIQNKIKKLGYKWDSNMRWYNYVSDQPEPKEIDFKTLFDNKVKAIDKIAKKDVSPSKDEALSNENKEINKITKESDIKSTPEQIEKRKEIINNTQEKQGIQHLEQAKKFLSEKYEINAKEKTHEYDMIDMLLDSKPKVQKVYKGYYIDEDIASIIDTVDKKKKSELVNQCLRKIFKEKGLL